MSNRSQKRNSGQTYWINGGRGQVLNRILFTDNFIDDGCQFDNMSDPRHRKLAAMGIADLVATGRPEVLDRLDGEILNLWLDVFVEMKEALVEISGEPAEYTILR